MDIEHPEVSSQQQIQSLKNLLTQILHKNTAYDCLPMNSSLNSVDKGISLYDAINILIHKDLEELLIWDEQEGDWIWMLTLVDAIRFITHALKSLLRHDFVDFRDFQKEIEEAGQMVSIIADYSKQKLQQVILRLEEKRIEDIILQISSNSASKDYIRLKTAKKQQKLSLKIHRILIEDPTSNTIISVLNFKDIFLYILRIANESQISYYSSIDIHSLLQTSETKNIEIEASRRLWEAFEIMTDRDKSLWINVVDKERRFIGMLFREDFRGIFQGWHVDYMWMTVGQFIHWKKANQKGNIPEYRFFQPNEYTKDILWKMVMSKRNAIVWVDSEHRVKATIGLMEIFRLYVS